MEVFGITLSDWGAIATVVGAPIAAGSAVVAVATFRAQVQTAADQHMHGLFRAYLTDKAEGDDQIVLRLYTLEEMFDWVQEQRRALPWPWLRLGGAAQRAKELDEWLATIASHIDDPERELERIRRFEACYGEGFRTFVETLCRDRHRDAEAIKAATDAADAAARGPA